MGLTAQGSGSAAVVHGAGRHTAIAYTMWVDGVARLRVQHSSILGLLTPVAAPIYAFVLLGQRHRLLDHRRRGADPVRRRPRRRVRRRRGGAGAAAVRAGRQSGGTAAPPAAGSVAPASAPRRDLVGYAIVLVSYLGMAGSAPLVAWADAPEAIILALRMAFAALALGVVFLRRPMLADWRRPGAAWRLVLMAAMSSLTLLLFFYAVRHTSVAIAMFLLFLMPVWVALAAPRFSSRRESRSCGRRSASPSPACRSSSSPTSSARASRSQWPACSRRCSRASGTRRTRCP